MASAAIATVGDRNRTVGAAAHAQRRAIGT